MNVLIVDDERVARHKVRSVLETCPDVARIAECADGAEAVERIRDEPVDLVFLDVQLPELTGFEVIRAVEPARMPAVVFVTAYDQYAIQAFDVEALDYLVNLSMKNGCEWRSIVPAADWHTPPLVRSDWKRSSRASGPRRPSIASQCGWTAGRSSSAWTRSTGSRRQTITCSCTSAGDRISCAARSRRSRSGSTRAASRESIARPSSAWTALWKSGRACAVKSSCCVTEPRFR